MNHRLSITCIVFKESNQFVALAPEINLAFNATKQSEAVKSLKAAFKSQVDFWKEKKIFKEKIKKLGLSSIIPQEEKDAIHQDLHVPMKLLITKHSIRTISMVVKD